MDKFHVEFDREIDGRWIADIPELPGVMAYGSNQEEAKANVEALALRVVATHTIEVRDRIIRQWLQSMNIKMGETYILTFVDEVLKAVIKPRNNAA